MKLYQLLAYAAILISLAFTAFCAGYLVYYEFFHKVSALHSSAVGIVSGMTAYCCVRFIILLTVK